MSVVETDSRAEAEGAGGGARKAMRAHSARPAILFEPSQEWRKQCYDLRPTDCESKASRLGALELQMISVDVTASACRSGPPRCWTLVSDLMPFSNPTINRFLRAGSGVRKPDPVLFEIFRFVARIPK